MVSSEMKQKPFASKTIIKKSTSLPIVDNLIELSVDLTLE